MESLGLLGVPEHHKVADWQEITARLFRRDPCITHLGITDSEFSTVRCSVAILMCTEAASQILGKVSLTENQKEAERTAQKPVTSSWIDWSTQTFSHSPQLL